MRTRLATGWISWAAWLFVALLAVARQAVERKTGARGLRAILEGALMDTMFDLPGSPDVISCVVTRDTVEKGAPPRVHKKPKPLPSAARKGTPRQEPLRNDAS